MDTSICKFIIIAPLSSISKRVRLFKITKFLFNSGVRDFEHIAWERIPGESIEKGLDFKLYKNIILRGGGYGGGKVKFMYLIWMTKIFFLGFKINRADNVWALGFESAFPLLLSSKIKGFKIYFDDADRFSMLLQLSNPFDKILKKLERITSRNVYKHVIPVKERYEFHSENFFVLANTPSKTELDSAYDLYRQKDWIKGNVVININGWLGQGRGMNTALRLYRELKDENIGFILAGKLDCDDAKLLAKQEKVQYLGKITNAEALASYFASDFVFTYYDPKEVINRYAASNKWGDAIFTKTAIIVNKEIKTAEYLIKNEVAISHPYYEYKNLAEDIKRMSKDSTYVSSLKSKINSLSESTPYFENQLKLLLSYEAK